MIAKQPNGKYQVRIYWQAKQVTMSTFKTLKPAQAWEAAQYLALSTGGWTNPKLGNIVLNDVISEFNEARLGAIAQHSWDTDEANLRNHVSDALKRRPVRAISEHDLEKLLVALLRKSSRHTVRRFRDSLVSLWKFAVKRGYVPVNVALATQVPAGEGEISTPVRPFFEADLAALIAGVRTDNEEYADVIDFLAHTGLRWGEIRALTVADVMQLPMLCLEVSRSHSDGYNLKSTKSGKPRSVPLDDRAAELVLKHSAEKSRSEYLFRSPRGKQLSAANFKRAVQWETRTDRRVHDLRHTAATNWIAAGLDVKTLSVWLGHSTSAITHRVYAGWLGNDANLAALEKLRIHQSRKLPAVVTDIGRAIH